MIRSKVAENPAAPYMLVQSLLVMQQAVANAQNRIARSRNSLPREILRLVLSQRGGSFPCRSRQPFRRRPTSCTATAHDATATAGTAGATTSTTATLRLPAASTANGRQRRAGGFLQGALSTAAGVAGGALLFQGIESLLGHNPGPFSGSVAPSGGLFGGGTPVENTEVINNYYNEGDENRGQVDQGNADQTAYADPTRP